MCTYILSNCYVHRDIGPEIDKHSPCGSKGTPHYARGLKIGFNDCNSCISWITADGEVQMPYLITLFLNEVVEPESPVLSSAQYDHNC